MSGAEPLHNEFRAKPNRELSVDVWDWTSPANDLTLFEKWVLDLKQLGGHRIEVSIPWNNLEPEPGRIDLTWLKERHAICKKHGMAMRLRINSYFRNAIPTWYKGNLWRDANGKVVNSGGHLPSINDERFWKHYAPMCTAIAKELRGEDVTYNAFIGPHAELKYADWWTFDESSMELWRKSSASPRPEWLTHVVASDADLPTTPSVPASTNGSPDLTPASLAFVAFREWTLRCALERFVKAIHAGDSDARISSPLGESFRRESACMSNLDYRGLSRGSSEVVHSYDFFIHNGATPLWHVAATVASFQGITGLPVAFEFDSPATITKNGYDESIQKAVAKAAWDQGAGLKFANFSYFDPMPSGYPVIRYAAQLAEQHTSVTKPGDKKHETVLLFFSKWANYCYREKTEWLHDAQFGWWKLLNDIGYPVRIICEDNLEEDLTGYRALVMAFSPPELIPQKDRRLLEGLAMQHVSDYSRIPTQRPVESFAISGNAGKLAMMASLPFDSIEEIQDETSALLRGNNQCFVLFKSARSWTLGFPLGYYYLHGKDQEQCLDIARAVLER